MLTPFQKGSAMEELLRSKKKRQFFNTPSYVKITDDIILRSRKRLGYCAPSIGSSCRSESQKTPPRWAAHTRLAAER